MKGTKVQILVALAELYSAHAMEQITFNVSMQNTEEFTSLVFQLAFNLKMVLLLASLEVIIKTKPVALAPQDAGYAHRST